jgi:photosystem II stability/assembly factor-like uncharacterized protein
MDKTILNVFLMKTAIVLLFLLGIRSESLAQWVPTNGPYYGIIHGFASIGDTLFASASNINEVYRSTDLGKNWQPMKIASASQYGAGGFPSLMAKNGILYVGVRGFNSFGGIYKSIDRGETWIHVDSGDAFSTTSYLNLGQNSKYIFAAGDSLRYSSDEGTTWIKAEGKEAKNIEAIAADDSFIVIATSKHLYRSSNLGNSWEEIDNIRDNITFSRIKEIDSVLFTYDYYINRSTDHGIHWITVDSTIRGFFDIISFGNNLVASSTELYVSKDNGKHWTKSDSGLTGSPVLELFEYKGILFAGTFSGWIYMSIDTGRTWATTNGGRPTGVRNFVSDDNFLYVATGLGIYRTENDGKLWVPRNKSLFISTSGVFSLAYGDSSLIASVGGELFSSQDKGDNWALLNNRYTFSYIWNKDSIFFGGYDGTPSRSGDIGLTWVEGAADSMNTSGYYPFTSAGNIIFSGCGISYLSGILRTDDLGFNWTFHSITNHTDDGVTSLAFNNGYLLAGMSKTGIYRSIDSGLTWDAANTGLTETNIKALLSSGKYFIAGTPGGVFLSTNYGLSWRAINESLPNKNVNTLFDFKGYLYAGILYDVVWKRPLSDFSSVSLASSKSSKFSIVSNPTYSTAEFLFDEVKDETLFELFDALGRSICRQQVSPGQTLLHIGMQKYPAGIYFARLGTETIRFVKI